MSPHLEDPMGLVKQLCDLSIMFFLHTIDNYTAQTTKLIGELCCCVQFCLSFSHTGVIHF